MEKSAGVLPAETPPQPADQHPVHGHPRGQRHAPRRWSSCTGKDTEFGKVSERLKLRPPETEFERGVRRFGYLLMEVTLSW